MLISVVVCTSYDRANLFDLCLDSLVNQSANSADYEVIIIDNNSSDSTQSIIYKYCSQHANYKSINEPNQGHSYARNRGWLEASGGYIAYIDDDAIADSNWIKSILEYITRNPGVCVFGGPYEATYLTAPPSWLPPNYGGLSLGNYERKLNLKNEFVDGPNLIIKKKLFTEGLRFRIIKKLPTQKLFYGEDTCILLDAKERGYDVYYVPTIKVKHLISKEKMTLDWKFKSTYSMGISSAMVFKDRFLVLHFGNVILKIFYMLYYFLLPKYMPLKKRIYLALNALIYAVGALVGHILYRFIQ